MTKFQVRQNPQNLLREVIIEKAAGLYLEVIDPLKEQFNLRNEAGTKGVAFVVTLGENWHESPEGTLYVVERVPVLHTQKLTLDDYMDAIMHYCEDRQLNWGCADLLNEDSRLVLWPA